MYLTYFQHIFPKTNFYMEDTWVYVDQNNGILCSNAKNELSHINLMPNVAMFLPNLLKFNMGQKNFLFCGEYSNWFVLL